MVVHIGSSPLYGPAAAKLLELREFVTAHGITPESIAGNGSLEPSSASAVQDSAVQDSGIQDSGANGGGAEQLLLFAEALFSRAPEPFLERLTVTSMLDSVLRCYRFYQDFVQSSSAFRVHGETVTAEDNQLAKTVLVTAVGDRPFIIDSLTELLQRRELDRYVYLHPILQENDGRHISLVYVEIEALDSDKAVQELVEDIERRLTDVILVTDDFSQMLVQVEAKAHLIAQGAGGPATESERREVVELLRWLADGGFVFLGYCEWECPSSNPENVKVEASENLGLFRSVNEDTKEGLSDTSRDVAYLARKDALFHFSKTQARSQVHRRARMDMVLLKTPSTDGSKIFISCFIGLLTSKSIAQESSSVPVIREKLQKILELEGLLPNTHNHKELVTIAEALPKSDLLLYPLDRLRQELLLIFELQRRGETRVSIFLDVVKRFVWINAIIPRNRFSDEAVQKIAHHAELLIQAEPGSAELAISGTEYPLALVRLLIPNPSLSNIELDRSRLETLVDECTLTWDDLLQRSLLSRRDPKVANVLFQFYRVAIPDQYKAVTSIDEAVFDIDMLESLDTDHGLEIAIEKHENHEDPTLCRLRLYKRGESLTLSAILPFLENSGFDIVSETVTPIAQEAAVWAAIYDLYVRPSSGEPVDMTIAEEALLPGLKLILTSAADNDKLNKLLLRPGLSCTEIAILRTLMRYLMQIKASPSESAVVDALVEHPDLANFLVAYFNSKFDPELFPNDERHEERIQKLEEIHEQFSSGLKNVHRLLHDRALRALFNVLEASVRTNFFRLQGELRIALKIKCSEIKRMPAPRPMFEIFVSGPQFDGVHLRGGKVARGGLRWSDRAEDFRTEILGLMKTQMVKNSIIIPVGAKGGFIVKNRPKNQDELMVRVEQCYKAFIRSLLEITDNLVGTDSIQPPNTVVFDEADPLLVVAADRGTATFSDVANKIAEDEFQFWLGDAFASGGSTGYDHKKYGITARGTWEAVCRHFREIGIDVGNQEFTVIGIGDMAGDVFGNGLLLSTNALLIAAFNHKHIFIDPSPDAAESFAERKRLFELPRSQWSDYDPKKLSKGGAVFERTQKEIHLSPEAQQALGTTASMVSGEDLIKIILKTPADLLWNGGIGTYVKSFDEDHSVVGDRANDDVRVSARELRVRVIGEGGNLGLTQLARIEYSRIGGHVNIDAVDNSGGVDLSDIEVNLKILLSEPVRDGTLTLEKRNALLLSCAHEACEKVISRNRSQSKVLSLAVRRSRKNIGYYRGLINALEQDGFLNREKEFLPDDETLGKRSALKAGLTRPELAILIAYCKMTLYNQLINSSVPEEPFLQKLLFNYFPRSVVEQFEQHVPKHPLKREIIATQVANVITERMGASFVYRSSEETGARNTDIILAFLAADAVIDAERITEELRIMDRANATRSHLLVLLRIQSAIDGITRWILENCSPSLGILEIVEKYHSPFRTLIEETDSLISDLERTRFQESCRQLIVNGVPKDLATAVAAASYATAYMDITNISSQTNLEVVGVAHLYSQLALVLQIRQLLEQASDIEPVDRWEALAIRTVTADLRKSVALLTKRILIDKGDFSQEAMTSYLGDRKEIIERYRNSVHEFNNRPMTIPALLVISNQLFALCRREGF